MEVWKDVDWLDGYRGVLEVSSIGRVRRRSYSYECLGRWGTKQTTTKPDKVLAPYKNNRGYIEIAIQTNGQRRKLALHHLVARAYVPGYEPGLTVNHINGVKSDNRVANLEWVTLAQNTKLQWETGLATTRGDNHPGRKLSSGKVRIIRRLLALGATPNELSVLVDVSPNIIYGIAKGRRWNSV